MPIIAIERESCGYGYWRLPPNGHKGTLTQMLEYYMSAHEGHPISTDQTSTLNYVFLPRNDDADKIPGGTIFVRNGLPDGRMLPGAEQGTVVINYQLKR